MQQDPEPLISISQAAERVGLNRSTLSRQVRKGAVRSHNGKVRLSEVVQDRSSNILRSRSGRHAGERDFVQQTDVAATRRATRRASGSDDLDEAMIDTATAIVARSGPVVAALAVELGLPCRVAYALSLFIFDELSDVADAHLVGQGLDAFAPGGSATVGTRPQGPDWAALAAKAGEKLDIGAWRDFADALPRNGEAAGAAN